MKIQITLLPEEEKYINEINRYFIKKESEIYECEFLGLKVDKLSIVIDNYITKIKLK